ncbi:MAG: aminotransferase class III-fold pyridoxal phosphate-dependent enzyme [Deltaproteobacteria bacterium]|jgi:4-aminobutyrate--pyruvate transaminase|nr:aminotransferase class III-fold pyridoxal phosphate-dependent enzyme [Deltaproteobacteria bacterium]
MTSSTLSQAQRSDIEHIIHPFSLPTALAQSGPLVIERGQGCYIFDENSRRYLEAMSGLWCISLGFSQPRLVEAARRQLEKLPFYHLFGARSHPAAIELAQELVKIAPNGLSHVLFASSGSEANDSAVKLAWYYNNALGRPRKTKIIARKQSYHGVTVASGSLTGQDRLHHGFNLPLREVFHTDFPSYYHSALEGESRHQFTRRLLDDLESLIIRQDPRTIAAFIAEPVITGAGVIPPPAGYFQGVAEILKKYEILFIVDEVVTGFGRTGAMFGSELYNLKPDMLSLAKSLTSAYQPLSALMVSDDVYRTIKQQGKDLGGFFHGTTYSAHPVAAAVALETLAIYRDEKIVERVKTLAPIFQKHLEALNDHPIVGETRCVGLLGAVELAADKAKRRSYPSELKVPAYVQAKALELGLVVRAAYNAVALCPPLIISREQIEEIFILLKEALDCAWAHFSPESLGRNV